MAARSEWAELLGPWDVEFAVAMPGGDAERLTFADAQTAWDRLGRVLGRRVVARACWPAIVAMVEAGRLPERAITSIQPMARDWLAGAEPEHSGTAFITGSLLGAHPELRAELLAGCSSSVADEVLDLVRQAEVIDAERATWNERRSDLVRGRWPTDATIVQVAGTPRWGAYLGPSGNHGWTPPLVRRDFVAVLDASSAGGCSTSPIDARTANWERRDTHEALFLTIALPSKPARYRTETVDIAALPALDPCLAVGNPGIYASPTVAAALEAAQLPGLKLRPADWTR